MSVGVVSILFVLPGLAYRLPPEPLPEDRRKLLDDLTTFVADWRHLALRGARLFNAISRLGLHLHEGASSITSLAEEKGLSASAAREISFLGQALWRHAGEDVERQVSDGRLRVDNASVLGRINLDDDFIRVGDDWVGWARTQTPRRFLRTYRERVDEVRQGRPVFPLTINVSYEDLEGFDEARKAASREARSVLTGGQTFHRMLDEFLEKHHPLYRAGAARRAADTTPSGPEPTTPGSRYIPAEVRRAVYRRTWDRCAVPYCDRHLFLQFSHRRPHREGGSREEDNLDLLCGWHHMLYEQGVITIEGSADLPVFKTREGRVIGADGCDGDFLDAAAREREAEDARDRAAKTAARAQAVDASRTSGVEASAAAQRACAAERDVGAANSSASAPPAPRAAAPPSEARTSEALASARADEPVSPNEPATSVAGASGSRTTEGAADDVPVSPVDPRAGDSVPGDSLDDDPLDDPVTSERLLCDALYPRKGEGWGIWPVR